jgi:hypothetical protein
MPDTGGKTPEQDVFLLIFRSFLPRRTLSDSNTCDIGQGAQLDTRTINWEKKTDGSSPSKQETKQPKVINELGSK